jgi:predicted nucleic acid-binding protein
VASFVDTNVAVYAFDRGAGPKRERAMELLLAPSEQLVVSSQVLAEFYWTVTRKLVGPLAVEPAREATRQLAALRVVPVDRDLVLGAIETASTQRVALWDAMIIEAAARGGCDRLWTEDLQHGQEIRGVRIENPFVG